ncbi:TetR/AcrR family transcriptional regulator [Paenibacillus dakarensis]|uniref:TetR/AcrR family transcriptional regulator n=1 Tax=Paenibacillus dakarensis TaxID=1527293 RepID=UPI0006D5B591|nr:TetR/AcrR family transcriptional regulator [Paenibacillus dakarensis]
MPNETEIQRLKVLRLSNEESNRITRLCIESALVLLMKERSFNEITITEIVKKAGVSRTAYYRNYSSKEDILRSLIDEMAIKVIEAMNLHFPIMNTHQYWLTLFDSLYEQYKELQILLKANFGDSVLQQVQDLLMRGFSERDTTELYKFYFWSGAIFNIVTKWIMDDATLDSKKMAQICFNIVDSIGEGCT